MGTIPYLLIDFAQKTSTQILFWATRKIFNKFHLSEFLEALNETISNKSIIFIVFYHLRSYGYKKHGF